MSEVNKKIKSAFWDYEIDPDEIYAIIVGERPERGFLKKEYLLRRILERLSWYEIVDIFGIDFLKNNITTDVISGMRSNNLKTRYELFRKVLQGEAVSFAGWSDENRKRLAASLLSDRWNRP